MPFEFAYCCMYLIINVHLFSTHSKQTTVSLWFMRIMKLCLTTTADDQGPPQLTHSLIKLLVVGQGKSQVS